MKLSVWMNEWMNLDLNLFKFTSCSPLQELGVTFYMQVTSYIYEVVFIYELRITSYIPVTSYTLFFIRTSKFCLRLAVLYFFFIFEAEMFLICSYFHVWNLQCHKECQTEYNKNTLFHIFHSFSFKQRT